ncbi:MAG TPA: hypothetical protein VJB41_03470 [Patescibacteria group bacterium]|nr:hypothetical protein [Patescibacteria group bacterium]
MVKKYKNQNGAAMVISVLILSVVMLSMALTGTSSFMREIQIIEAAKNKKISLSAANACIELAMDRLGRNINYQGNETINNGALLCDILAINPGPPWTIKTEASRGNQSAKMQAVLSSRSPVIIDSWEEIEGF